MAEEKQSPGLTPEQEKLANERAEAGVCVVCGEPRWYCGGEFAHKRKQDLGQ